MKQKELKRGAGGVRRAEWLRLTKQHNLGAKRIWKGQIDLVKITTSVYYMALTL